MSSCERALHVVDYRLLHQTLPGHAKLGEHPAPESRPVVQVAYSMTRFAGVQLCLAASSRIALCQTGEQNTAVITYCILAEMHILHIFTIFCI